MWMAIGRSSCSARGWPFRSQQFPCHISLRDGYSSNRKNKKAFSLNAQPGTGVATVITKRKAIMHFHALAVDYDGTIAHHGRVDEITLNALKKLRESGRKLLLV